MTGEELRATLEGDVLAGARRLLGCAIHYPGGTARIVETEAYRGSDDPGCHAFGKIRMKNMGLFGPPGHAYVYLSYGIHQMLNVVALPPGEAAGVLIRALRPVAEIGSLATSSNLLRGPGRLSRTLGVTSGLNGEDVLNPLSEIWIEPGAPVSEIFAGPRIGLSAGKGDGLPWRFVAADDLAWISATKRGLAPERS